MDKSLFKSRTFYFNVLMALSPLVPAVNAWLVANPAMFASIWGGLGIVLRMLTKDKVVLIG